VHGARGGDCPLPQTAAGDTKPIKTSKVGLITQFSTCCYLLIEYLDSHVVISFRSLTVNRWTYVCSCTAEIVPLFCCRSVAVTNVTSIPLGTLSQFQIFHSIQVNFLRTSTHVHVRYICCRPSIVCLFVTFVHPTQPFKIFGNDSSSFVTLAIRWHPQKIIRKSSQGAPPLGFKRKSMQIWRLWSYRRLYLENGAR